jgi:hypothetical protein
MIYLTVFISAVVTSTSAAYLMKYRFERALPFALLSMIAVSYIFGLFGVLFAGFAAAAAATAVSLVFFVRLLVKDRAFLVKNIFTPGFFMFAVFFVFFCVIFTYHTQVSIGDDFTHWAYIVKQMTDLDLLHSDPRMNANFPGFPYQYDPSKMQDFRSYPPAQDIFLWLVQKANSGVFSEPLLYSARNLLGFSLLLPFSDKLSHKKPFMNLIVFIIIVFLPMTFFMITSSSIYNNLMVDYIISFFFIYMLMTYFEAEKKDVRLLINLCLAGFVGSLIKSSAVLFILSACIVIIVLFLKENGKARKNLIAAALCIASPLIAVGSWWLSLKINSFSTPAISNAVNIGDWLKTGEPAYVTQAAEVFLKSQFSSAAFYMNNIFNLPVIAIFGIVLLCTVIFGILGITSKRESAVLFIAFSVMYIVYQLSLMVSYMFYFTEREAFLLASYERYSGTLIMSYFLVLIYFLIRLFSGDKKEMPPRLVKFTNFFGAHFVPAVICIAILILIPQTRMEEVIIPKPYLQPNTTIELANRVKSAIAEDGSFDPEEDHVAILFNNKQNSKYVTVNYYFYPLKPQNFAYSSITTQPMTKRNFLETIITLGQAETLDALTVTPGEYMDYLKENRIGYVLVYEPDDRLRREYASLFNISPGRCFLYKAENGKLVFYKDLDNP